MRGDLNRIGMRAAARRMALLACLLLAGSNSVLFAQSHTDEEQLQAAYAGKILTLRHFYEGERLNFGAMAH